MSVTNFCKKVLENNIRNKEDVDSDENGDKILTFDPDNL